MFNSLYFNPHMSANNVPTSKYGLRFGLGISDTRQYYPALPLPGLCFNI